MPEIDLTHYQGREQAYVKHCLLENYLAGWGYKVGSAWDTLIYVDGFAGPWGAKDEQFGDASFGIAFRVIRTVVQGMGATRQIALRGLCIFVEKKPDAFAKLQSFAKSNSAPGVKAVALKGRFTERLPEITKEIAATGGNPFKFVFLDQKGWAGAPMRELKPFISERSCEVLFNLMTSFLTRFVNAKGRESSYHDLFGRHGVLDKIRSLPKGTGEREDAAVREYCISLRDLCGFRYVAEAVIVDPEKEKVRYYLVFATNDHRGVEVFKRAEMEAARIQDDVRHETQVRKSGQPEFKFADGPPKSRLMVSLRERYRLKARRKVIETLLRSAPSTAVPFENLYCEAMAFPLVTPADLENWLRELVPHVELRSEGRKLSPAGQDSIVVLDRTALGA